MNYAKCVCDVCALFQLKIIFFLSLNEMENILRSHYSYGFVRMCNNIHAILLVGRTFEVVGPLLTSKLLDIESVVHKQCLSDMDRISSRFPIFYLWTIFYNQNSVNLFVISTNRKIFFTQHRSIFYISRTLEHRIAAWLWNTYDETEH